MFVSLPVGPTGVAPIKRTRRGERSGAAAASWTRGQSYDVEAAARDPRTPEATMVEIALNATGRIVNMLAANKGATEKVLNTVLDASPTDQQLQRIACHPNATGDVLERAWVMNSLPGNGRLLGKIERHPNVSEYVYEVYFAPLGGSEVILSNPRISIEFVVRQIDALGDPGRIQAVRDARRAEVLEKLEEIPVPSLFLLYPELLEEGLSTERRREELGALAVLAPEWVGTRDALWAACKSFS